MLRDPVADAYWRTTSSRSGPWTFEMEIRSSERNGDRGAKVRLD